MKKQKSIFDNLRINISKEAFKNAIRKGLKEPENWMYMYSNKTRDYFKNQITREYISYFNLRNIIKF